MMHWFDGYGMGNGFGGFGMIFFWVLFIIVIFYLVKNISGFDRGRGHLESPEEILKKRYAKGEIDKKEYEEKLRGIGRGTDRD